MLTPTAKTALSPALSIMQSIVTDRARLQQLDKTDAFGNSPNVAVTPGYSTQTTQKLNAYYFGDHQSVTEVQAKIFSYLAEYVGKQLDTVENEIGGKPAGETATANKELSDSLKGMETDVRSSLRTTLNDFAEGKQSLQATAIKMVMTLDLDVLSKDTKIGRYLEQMIGFDLHGMSAKDILMSFADPGGKESEKLRSIISDALAGQDGSKVMQRLDDASKGLRSVEETKRDIEDVKPYDEVDDETKQEDKEDLKTAKAYDTLNDTKNFVDTVKEEEVALAEAKAAIEMAKGSAKPKETSTPPTSEEGTGSDDLEADGKNDAGVNRVWGYWESTDQPGNQNSDNAQLYL